MPTQSDILTVAMTLFHEPEIIRKNYLEVHIPYKALQDYATKEELAALFPRDLSVSFEHLVDITPLEKLANQLLQTKKGTFVLNVFFNQQTATDYLALIASYVL
ncbi:hypothetical protein [Vagococcus acidifermentans]|uniref:Uncharacterized protein n=1 Tax=Vagococcus acidifermentans TaxID=564710 RepID=A0A430APK8_9ENTE|nr:hypothetical protein [Vagococcus acidifermentans]RSU10100.1 hypothetical protein CBF27_11280 [Vagococcus acidifermentans]